MRPSAQPHPYGQESRCVNLEEVIPARLFLPDAGTFGRLHLPRHVQFFLELDNQMWM